MADRGLRRGETHGLRIIWIFADREHRQRCSAGAAGNLRARFEGTSTLQSLFVLDEQRPRRCLSQAHDHVQTLSDPLLNEFFGSSVCNLGDANGDTRRDLSVGSPGRNEAVLVSRGRSAGTPCSCWHGTGGACPCANFGASDEGCASSLGHGATLYSFGSDFVGGDDLVPMAVSVRPNMPCISPQGASQIATPFKDGLLGVGTRASGSSLPDGARLPSAEVRTRIPRVRTSASSCPEIRLPDWGKARFGAPTGVLHPI